MVSKTSKCDSCASKRSKVGNVNNTVCAVILPVPQRAAARVNPTAGARAEKHNVHVSCKLRLSFSITEALTDVTLTLTWTVTDRIRSRCFCFICNKNLWVIFFWTLWEFSGFYDVKLLLDSLYWFYFVWKAVDGIKPSSGGENESEETPHVLLWLQAWSCLIPVSTFDPARRFLPLIVD